MKKLIMMMAMAVGLTGLAAQNDKLISFHSTGPNYYSDGKTVIANGECFALIWVKTGASFAGFNADGTLCDQANNAIVEIAACANNGGADYLFQVSAKDDAGKYAGGSYSVYVLDTRDANGVPSAVTDNAVSRVAYSGLCQNEAKQNAAAGTMQLSLTAATGVKTFLAATPVVYEEGDEVTNFSSEGPDRYADGSVLVDTEIYLLVRTETGKSFSGLTWDCQVKGEDGEIVKILGKANGGKCPESALGTLEKGYDYQVLALDTRRPDTGKPIGDTVFFGSGLELPALVVGYAEFCLDDANKAVLSNWRSVKIDESAYGQAFDFDPTSLLTDNCVAVYGVWDDEDTNWSVFPLPTAYFDSHDAPALKVGENYWALHHPADLGDTFTMESAYAFKAYEDDDQEKLVTDAIGNMKSCRIASLDDEEIMATIYPDDEEKREAFSEWFWVHAPFFEWNADFEVSFDDFVREGTVILAGSYPFQEMWPQYHFDCSSSCTWAGACTRFDMAKGQTVRLLTEGYASQGVHMTYAEICTKVKTFLCGVCNVKPENWGKTINVSLNLYQTKRDSETGEIAETGRKYTVGSYKYTFKGPLNVKFYSNDVELVELAISTNHDGRTEFALPTYATGNPELAFTGWTNKWGKTVAAIPIMVREATEKTDYVKTWYAGDEDTLELYATFKAATTISIKPTEDTPIDKKVAFKVTDEWLSLNGLEKTEEALEAPQGAAERPAWQNYLLGMDPNADLKVEKTNGNEDDKALVVSTVQVVAPDAGIKVGYSLDRVDAKEGVEKPGAEQATKDLKIDLEPQDDTPTGYYKMNVIFTPTENGEEGEKITIPADNTIGVLKVETQEPVVPVAVPWSSLEDGTDIPVNEIVKTSTLSEGDLMHVYDQDQKAYVNLKLDANGEWTPVKAYKLDDVGKVTDTTIEIDMIDTKKVTRGSSVWLERKDTSKPFYLIGQYKKGSHATTTIKTKEVGAVKPEANLIAPPGIEDTDLNEVVNTDIGAKDQLMIVKEGVPTYFQWKNDKWSYPKQVYTVDEKGRARTTTTWVDNEAVVPAGLGLWYLSDSGTPVIAWPEPTDEQGENK